MNKNTQKEMNCEYHGCKKIIRWPKKGITESIRVNHKNERRTFCSRTCAVRAQMSAEG